MNGSRLIGTLTAVTLLGGCIQPRYSPSDPGAQWEEAVVPICAADTEGEVVQGQLRGSAKPEFEGRVIRVASDGSRLPVPNVRFFQYVRRFWVPGAVPNWDPDKSYLAPESFTSGDDGTFRAATTDTTPSVVLVRCRNEQPVEEQVPVAVLFLLRAPGCQDLRVVFDINWVWRDIEIKCDSQ